MFSKQVIKVFQVLLEKTMSQTTFIVYTSDSNYFSLECLNTFIVLSYSGSLICMGRKDKQ